jgi:hypothetical protein
MYEQSTPPLYVISVFTIFLLLSVLSLLIFIRLHIQRRRQVVDSTPKSVPRRNWCWRQPTAATAIQQLQQAFLAEDNDAIERQRRQQQPWHDDSSWQQQPQQHHQPMSEQNERILVPEGETLCELKSGRGE